MVVMGALEMSRERYWDWIIDCGPFFDFDFFFK